MKKNNKVLYIIIGVLVAIAIAVLCIVLIPNDNSNTNDPTTSTTPTDTTTPTQPETEEDVMKEYDELKNKLKDIYPFVPEEPFKYSDDINKDVFVKDITNTFEIFPSTQITNKDGNEVLYKEEIYEITNNVSEFDHLLLDSNKPKLNEETNEWEFPFKSKMFNIDLSNYNYTDDEYPDSHYYYMVYKNIKNMVIVSNQFATEAEYYQACYDVMMEFLKMLEGKDLKPYLASTVSYYSVSMMYEAIDAGNYDVLFDAIMNQKICMVYVDENQVYHKIEVTDKDANYDGEVESCLNMFTAFEFDDEDKYMNPNPQQ